MARLPTLLGLAALFSALQSRALEHQFVAYKVIQQRTHDDRRDIRDHVIEPEPNGERFHQNQIPDDGDQPIGNVETKKPCRNAAQIELSMCPRPQFVPHEVVKNRALYGDDRCDADRPAQTAFEERENQQLNADSDDADCIESQPGRKSGLHGRRSSL